MGIWIFYLLAIIPAFIGGVLWIKNKQIALAEWICGSAAGFILALIFQFASVAGMTGDIETWSGYISHATFYPRWVEEYQQMHTRQVASGTDSNGNTTYTTEVYYTTEYRTHREHWVAYTTIPDDHEISKEFFQEITANFGGKITTETPYKSGFHEGDRNIYVAYRKTDYIYPVTALKSWENRIKAAPTLFSFIKVPEDAPVAPWPKNPNWRQSERLIGQANADFNILDLDRLNARIGAKKKINLIIIGFGDKDSSIAELQRAKWVGGKKNDLVICYGGQSRMKPNWVKVFGWSDSEICKRNIESIFLDNLPGTDLLLKIEQEIVSGYKIKDWSAFDYITIQPPTWSYWVYGVVLILSQVGFYFFAHNNEYYKISDKWRRVI